MVIPKDGIAPLFQRQVTGQSQTASARYSCVIPVVVVSWHLDITWILSVLRLQIQTVGHGELEKVEKPELIELPHILSRGGTMGKGELLASALCDFF